MNFSYGGASEVEFGSLDDQNEVVHKMVLISWRYLNICNAGGLIYVLASFDRV